MPIPRVLLPIVLSASAGLTCPLFAHDPITTKLTWSREISRLLAAHCIPCHQAGGSAPFPLSTYAAVRPWAVAIREEVTARRMPPWNAVGGFGRFAPDSSLTQAEIQLIAGWVNGGAPEGDPRYLDPALPGPHTSPPTPPGEPLEAADRLALPAGTLTALRIRSLPPNSRAHLLLQHPDGRLQPLAWLRSLSPHAPTLYRFAEPVSVSQGSMLRLWAPRGVRLELISSRSPSRPAAPE